MNIYKVKKLPEAPVNPCEVCSARWDCSGPDRCRWIDIYKAEKALYDQFLVALKPVGAEEITKLYDTWREEPSEDWAGTFGEFIVKKLGE